MAMLFTPMILLPGGAGDFVGAIAIAVVDKDGKPASGFMTSVREVEKSPLRTGPFLDIEGKTTASANDGVHAFTATPLPLDGTYEVVNLDGRLLELKAAGNDQDFASEQTGATAVSAGATTYRQDPGWSRPCPVDLADHQMNSSLPGDRPA